MIFSVGCIVWYKSEVRKNVLMKEVDFIVKKTKKNNEQ